MELKDVPDHFKNQEMYDKVVPGYPCLLEFVPDRFKTQEMCIKAVEVDPWQLKDIPDDFKTQEMCIKAVRDYLFSFRLVPDWFVTYEQLNLWYYDDYVYNDNGMIEWYKGYRRHKAQKTSIKGELTPIA